MSVKEDERMRAKQGKRQEANKGTKETKEGDVASTFAFYNVQQWHTNVIHQQTDMLASALGDETSFTRG